MRCTNLICWNQPDFSWLITSSAIIVLVPIKCDVSTYKSRQFEVLALTHSQTRSLHIQQQIEINKLSNRSLELSSHSIYFPFATHRSSLQSNQTPTLWYSVQNQIFSSIYHIQFNLRKEIILVSSKKPFYFEIIPKIRISIDSSQFIHSHFIKFSVESHIRVFEYFT